MKTRSFSIALLVMSIALSNCSVLQYHAKYIEPHPRVDTKSRPISYQEKTQYSFNQGAIRFDNLFDAARMNDCDQINDSTFNISILPENTPINASPWYAFRMISQYDQNVYLNLEYTGAKHRYQPKISTDKNNWALLDSTQVSLSNGDSVATLQIHLTHDTTWLAAQELYSFSKVLDWCSALSDKPEVELDSMGTSVLGRPLIYLDISTDKKRKKPIVVILSRQHPPEVTGQLAMKAFVETILDGSDLSKQFLQKYHVLVYPIINPDGVDLGHWRHNVGGVDLNRDWGNYKQPEIRQVTDHIVTQSKRMRAKVVLGIDFHSTQYDIFYTNNIDPGTMILGDFRTAWIDKIDKALPGYNPRVEPSSYLPVATSKNWFYAEFHAAGIIYEVGDQTPRDFIAKKARTAAVTMMELLK